MNGYRVISGASAAVLLLAASANADVRDDVLHALREAKLEAAAIARAEAVWPAGAEHGALRGEALLERVVATCAAAIPQVQTTIAALGQPLPSPPRWEALRDESLPAMARQNLRLFVARRLTQEQLYDEALELLAGLTPEQVVDPASLLFCRAVAQHRLLQVAECLETTAQLLELGDDLPRRYETLAKLMQADLADVKADSLDHISRRMDDVSRRLSLGHGGAKVRQQEDEILASLDKLIKQLEDQRQQQSSSSASQPKPAGKPLEGSRIAEGKGPGKVDRKDIGQGRGWGDLPPKQREEALQRLGQDFPGHYREIIEEYFRRLATERERE